MTAKTTEILAFLCKVSRNSANLCCFTFINLPLQGHSVEPKIPLGGDEDFE